MVAALQAQSLPWCVRSMRATVFMDGRLFDGAALERVWGLLLPAPPDESGPHEGGWHVAGTVGTSRLMMASADDRLDLVQAMAATPTAAFQERWPVFVDLARRWAAAAEGRPRRVAIGATLFLPCPDAASAFRQVAQLLPVRFRPDDGADFAYQINRWKRRDDVAPAFTVNRISRWSVLDAGPGAARGAWECVLELDLNSDARRTEPLPEGCLVKLLEDFADDAVRISKEGDPV